MREPLGKRSSSVNSAFTSGCLLLLVLVADVAAGLLSLVLLVARGMSRATDSARTAVGRPPADWAPVLCFGTLSLAVCVTGAMLLRLGHRGLGTVQLVLCLVPAAWALSAWP
ncbi:inner-membrane translocator [Streptomyces sp. Tu 6176]|uniref:hypothetical protein n=1 Tax=Streptomyces sp. Tu 6176 TaxID=1470557 RepID=UPI00044B7AA1|nr:hypothetical protein [Streptomyces sp. Tu 6176]EYT83512.1 inner-membrane translocator [Streptomyces sp. Tu 6176]